MERIRVISYQGQRLLFVDCTNCGPEEVANIADHVPQAVQQEPSGTVLLLADFSDSHLSREALERVKIAAVFNRQHLRRSAWVWTENLPQPAHDAVQKFSIRDIPVFRTRQEAMDYLVQTG